MLHELPVANVRLSPCHVAADQLMPVAGGHYCAECQRTVHDFTQASAAELAQARATAPDGRLCGRFRLSQLTAESRPMRPQLRPRLRQFLLAAVLVLLRGLTAGQAWAQVRQPTAPLYQLPGSLPMPAAAAPADTTKRPSTEREQAVFGAVAEKMPQPQGGWEGLMKFLQQEAHYPVEALRSGLAGKVFVSFTVTRTGQITGAHIVRGLTPPLDAEVLRLVQLMPPWTPGEQNGQAVDVRYTLPITFGSPMSETKSRKPP
ncbi:energy transducer TonB [Hymenobacter edaphi]|uniref:TonB C-terminal domain-containing protein n=1 Tax=Hymenobacter edaphi TaxID=2211146 RepID=A0A328BPX9_9BACT|nr:energy transducer TonB [Hymenobacter edaphi]RAK67994.1 hypothetical protein DLM85_08100 [Hymenobacter edaphi]